MSTGRSLIEEARLSRDIYFSEHYFSELELLSLVAQIRIVHGLAPKTMLEIGKGNGFVSDFLGKSGIDVTTFDINPNLAPDVTGSVLDLASHFPTRQFDVVLCAEVLEHLPFASFSAAIEQIAAVTAGWVVLTLPTARRTLLGLEYSLKIPKIDRIVGGLTVRWGVKAQIGQEHHWELDLTRRCSIQEVKMQLRKYFHVESCRPIRHNPYHYCFILSRA
jgi:hypothetical protein